MVTGIVEVTQDPEKAGSALKILSLRLRGMKGQLEELGEETDENVENISKMQGQILNMTKGKVNIFDGSGNFKSTYEIMKGIAEVWDELSSIDQADLLETIAGKNRANDVASLLANWQNVEEAVKSAYEAEGSAAKENAKYVDSLQGRLDKLTTAWQSFANTFMESDFLKGAIGALTKFVEILEGVVDTLGTGGTLATVGGIWGIFSKLSSTSKAVGGLTSLADILPVLSLAFPNAAKGATGLFNVLKNGGGIIATLGAGFKGLWGIIAAHPILALVAAVGAGIAIFAHFHESAKELKERIEEVTSSYREQHDALTKVKADYDTSNEDSMISKYGKLSKGVNEFGENLSLTADEYSEYQSIVNTIAEQIPSLVIGYNSQGDAILDCAGDVARLNEEYKNLIKTQNGKVLDSGKDILKDFQNDLEGEIGYGSDNLKKYTKALETMLNGEGGFEEALKNLSTDDIWNISQLLDENGFKRDVMFGDGIFDFNYESQEEHIRRAIKENSAKVKKILKETSIDLNAYAEDMGAITEAYFNSAFLGGDAALGIDDYSNISERMQSIISQVASGFDSSFYAKFLDDTKTDEENYEALTKYYDSLLNAFKGLNNEDALKLESVFDIKTQFNSGEISYGEYVNKLKSVDGIINSLKVDDDIKAQIKLSLDTEEATKNYDILKNRLITQKYGIKMTADEAKEFLNGLSASEYAVAVDLIASDEVDLSNFNAESLREYIKEEAELQEALTFKLNISAEAEGIDALNTAMKESVDAAGLSSESFAILKSRYAELDDYDPSKLFERTSQGIHLNREELNKLEKQLADSKIKEVDKDLDALTKAYADVTEKIRDCSDETKRNELVAEQLKYANRIKELSEMRSQYEGLTSAYNNWINAQESGEEGDIYDDVIEKLESAAELRKKGLVGTNEFAAAVGFMSGKDTSSMTVDEIVKAYDEATPKMQRYFTDSSKGAQNLLNDLNGINKEWAYINENGEWKLNIPLEEAAKELGISVDALEAVLGKGSDYGLTINYDSVYEAADSLETLYTKAESANNKLKELGHTDFTFSFESTDAKDLEMQIEKAQEIVDTIKEADEADDGKINLSVEGAEESKRVLETLMRQKQEVTKPAFMEVSYSVLGDADLGNAIRLLQSLQSYKNTYDVQVAINADTSETETKIQEVIGEINTLKTENPQVFADLNLNTKEFNTALNTLSGNINAKAQLDPASLETVQTALSGINATVLADVGIGNTDALNTLEACADVTPIPTTTNLGDGFFGNATIKVAPDITDFGNIFTGTAGITPYLTARKLTVEIESKEVSEVNGTANVNGTAFANGTTGKAFKQGSWSTKDSGTALVGELGMETLVRDGRFYTIGDTGAEFVQYRKGDIIFNHEQTKELFEHGKVTSGGGRGKMFANGTAFAEGTAFYDGNNVAGGGTLYYLQALEENARKAAKKAEEAEKAAADAKAAIPANNVEGGGKVGAYETTKSSSSSSSPSSTKTKDDFKETIDWIEIAISRIEREIDNLDKKANNVYKSWSSRSSALTEEITKVRDEIQLQSSAYDEYMSEANNVGLSKSWAKKVREGKVDIETIKDEALAEKIKNYQNWYEKALQCKDTIEDLKETESALYAQRFENIQTQYDGILQGYEHTETMLDEYISQAEEQGHIVSKSYYQALIDNERSNVDQLVKERTALIQARDEAVASGAITKDSEEW